MIGNPVIKKHRSRRTRALPHTLTAAPARLVLLPNFLDATGEPCPALIVGRTLVVFRDIPAALAARREIEARV